VATSVIANDHASPSLSEVAQSSFGGEVDRVTPLQLALVASAVANRGVLMAPYLVQRVVAADGTTLQEHHNRTLGRVMSANTARDVASAMTFVVDFGSGIHAQIPGIKVAGKTGTAASGGYYPHAWFISFAPADKPVIAVAVLHEFSGEAFQFAAPLARQVLEAGLRAKGIKLKK
jgi:peptidoglycan glycosyltransferase